MQRRSLYKNIFLASLAIIILPAASFSSASMLNELKIPSEIGSIKEVFAPGPSGLPAGKTIICIQDAHCNYEAQKNLARILDLLAREKNLKLILVEGGVGDIGMSFMRDLTDSNKKKDLAEIALQNGEISGEEYLDIVSDYNLELYGIEDSSLYEKNAEAFYRLDLYRERGLADVDRLNAAIQVLKQRMYNPGLRELEKAKSRYGNNEISLSEYCSYMVEKAKKADIPLDDFVSIRSYAQAALLEKSIDPAAVDIQRAKAIKDMASILDAGAARELAARTQSLKASAITENEYYDFIRSYAEGKLDLTRDYPAFDAYVRYVSESARINASGLVNEISLLEDELGRALAASAEEKRLAGIAKALDIIGKVFRLELNPQDYAYMQAHQSDFLTADWCDFLNAQAKRNAAKVTFEPSQTIDDNFSEIKEFYTLGLQREQAFISNIVNKMDQSDQTIAALVTGGFHTPGVSRQLQDEGYSYAVITPAISKTGDNGVYLSALRGQEYSIIDSFSEEEDYEATE